MFRTVRLPYTCLVFVTIFFLSAAYPAFCGTSWQTLHPSPSAETLHDSWSPDGSTFYFVGDGGTILKYAGQSLTRMDSPTTLPLKAIHGTGPNDIWAVGGSVETDANGDRAVILHYNGQAWSTVPAPVSDLGYTYPLTDVYAAGPSNVWATQLGSSQPARYNGQAWSAVPTYLPFYSDMTAICGFGASNVVFVGKNTQVMRWNGSVFTNISPDLGGSSDFTACWGPDADTLFLGNNLGGMLRLGSDGQHAALPSTAMFTITNITGTSATDVMFTGYAGHVVHYDGSQSTDLAFPDMQARRAIVRAGDGSYLLAGERGLVERLQGQTATRLSQDSPLGVVSVARAFWDDGLWVVPSFFSAGAPIQILLDGRIVLTSPPTTDEYLSYKGGRALAGNDVRLCATNSSTGNDVIVRFDGDTWSDWYPPEGYRAMQDILKTGSGETFALLQGGYAGYPCKVGATSSQCYSAAGAVFRRLAEGPDGVYAVGDDGKIAVYKNGAWSGEATGTDTDFTAVASVGQDVYAVGTNRRAWWKRLGQSWQPVTGLNEKTNWDFAAVAPFQGSRVYAVLNGTDGTLVSFIYALENGAATLAQGWLTGRLVDLALHGGTLFAVGDYGVVRYVGNTPSFVIPSGGMPISNLLLLLD